MKWKSTFRQTYQIHMYTHEIATILGNMKRSSLETVNSQVLFIFCKQNNDWREVLSLVSLSEILKPGGHLSSPFRFWQLLEKWHRRESNHRRFQGKKHHLSCWSKEVNRIQATFESQINFKRVNLRLKWDVYPCSMCFTLLYGWLID